jgi:hypothetical protein
MASYKVDGTDDGIGQAAESSAAGSTAVGSNETVVFDKDPTDTFVQIGSIKTPKKSHSSLTSWASVKADLPNHHHPDSFATLVKEEIKHSKVNFSHIVRTVDGVDYIEHLHNLPTDIFSLAEVVDTHYGNKPEGKKIQCLALLCWCLTTASLGIFLTTTTIANGSENSNLITTLKQQLPADVSATFRLGQILALTLTFFFTSEELYNSLIECGSDDSMKDRVWNFMRFTNGYLTFIVCLLVIVSQDDLVDMFKDFTAITFLVELDVIMYNCIIFGMFGEKVQYAAKMTPLEMTHKKFWAGSSAYVRIFCTIVITSPFIISFLAVWSLQNGDQLLCNTVDVKISPSAFNSYNIGGLYKYNGLRDRKTGYPMYIQQSNHHNMSSENAQHALLFFEKRWYFFDRSVIHDGVAFDCLEEREDEFDENTVKSVCQLGSYNARSEKTEVFDPSSVELWRLETGAGWTIGLIETECADCQREDENSETTCNKRANAGCSSGDVQFCQCDSKYRGKYCTFNKPAAYLEIHGLVSVTGSIAGPRFSLLGGTDKRIGTPEPIWFDAKEDFMSNHPDIITYTIEILYYNRYRNKWIVDRYLKIDDYQDGTYKVNCQQFFDTYNYEEEDQSRKDEKFGFYCNTRPLGDGTYAKAPYKHYWLEDEIVHYVHRIRDLNLRTTQIEFQTKRTNVFVFSQMNRAGVYALNGMWQRLNGIQFEPVKTSMNAFQGRLRMGKRRAMCSEGYTGMKCDLPPIEVKVKTTFAFEPLKNNDTTMCYQIEEGVLTQGARLWRNARLPSCRTFNKFSFRFGQSSGFNRFLYSVTKYKVALKYLKDPNQEVSLSVHGDQIEYHLHQSKCEDANAEELWSVDRAEEGFTQNLSVELDSSGSDMSKSHKCAGPMRTLMDVQVDKGVWVWTEENSDGFWPAWVQIDFEFKVRKKRSAACVQRTIQNITGKGYRAYKSLVTCEGDLGEIPADNYLVCHDNAIPNNVSYDYWSNDGSGSGRWKIKDPSTGAPSTTDATFTKPLGWKCAPKTFYRPPRSEFDYPYYALPVLHEGETETEMGWSPETNCDKSDLEEFGFCDFPTKEVEYDWYETWGNYDWHPTQAHGNKF